MTFRKSLGALLLVSTTIIALALFQNCSQPLELAEEDASTFGDGLPFAYDVKMDTFSYMSCFDMTATNYDRRAIYNFRIGAYEPSSGIKLTEAFKDGIENFKNETKANALVKSPTNSGAILQFATRATETNYQSIWLNDGGVVTVGEDLDNFLAGAPLSAPGIANALTRLEGEERIQYFKGVPGLSGRLLEASLRYHNNLKGVTDQFLRSGLNLAITYTPENNTLTYFARTPDPTNQQRDVFGYKFVPSFAGVQKWQGVSGSHLGTWGTGNSIKNRTITGLREIDIQSKKATEWHCPADLKLVVIEPTDSNVCPRTASEHTFDNPTGLSERDKKRLEVIRRVLRVEDYYVNLEENCVIPKSKNNSCYPTANEQSNITVDINYGKSPGATSCSDNPGAGAYGCPNYVSICTREALPN